MTLASEAELSSDDFTSLQFGSKKSVNSRKNIRIVLPFRYLAVNDVDLVDEGVLFSSLVCHAVFHLEPIMSSTETLILSYYDAFNRGDMQTFLGLLDEQVIHHVNQGGFVKGKLAFTAFMSKMNLHYREQVSDLVVMIDKTGTRAVAEFRILGTYLKTDSGLPEARGQTYDLPVGAFFDIKNGKITRVANFYNLTSWIAMVS